MSTDLVARLKNAEGEERKAAVASARSFTNDDCDFDFDMFGNL